MSESKTKNSSSAVFAIMLVAVVAFSGGLMLYAIGPGSTVSYDDGCYYLLGKSLASGQGYRELWTPGEPLHALWPPGYPAVLAFVMGLWGDTPQVLKIPNALFGILGLVASLVLLRQRCTRAGTIIGGCLIGLNPMLLLFTSGYLRSEAMFFGASCASLAFLELSMKSDAPGKRRAMVVLCALFVLGSLYARSIGAVLALSCLFGFAIARRWRAALTFGAIVVIGYSPWLLRQYELQRAHVQTYGTFIAGDTPGSKSAIAGGIDYAVRYVTSATPQVISPGLPLFADRIARRLVGVEFRFLLHALLVLLALVGALVDLRRPGKAFHIYVAFSYLVFFRFPTFNARFVLPLLPILVRWIVIACECLFSSIAARTGVPRVLRYSFGTVAALMVVFAARYQVLSAQGCRSPQYPEPAVRSYIQAAQWIRDNTQRDVVVASRTAPNMSQWSERHSVMWLSGGDSRRIVNGLSEARVSFVVADSITAPGRDSDRIQTLALQREMPQCFHLVKSIGKPATRIYRFVGSSR